MPVELTVLGQRDVPMPGEVATLSGNEMRLLLEGTVRSGGAVRLDVDGTVLLGEACYCVREEGAHAIGVHLHHAITLSDELARLMQGLLGESSPPDRDAEGPQSHYRQASDPVVDRGQKHH